MDELFTSEKLSEFLKFQFQRKTVFLAKALLETLEKFRDESRITDEEFSTERKRVLDRMGDTHREMNEIISRFKIDLA